MGIVYTCCLTTLLFSVSTWARAPLDVAQDVVVVEQGAEAEQEAFKKAVEDTSMKLISESIGAEALEKNAPRIKLVLAKSEKYVLFIKGSGATATPDGTRVHVDMKISLDNLEALLREHGLLQAASRGQRMLPLMEWGDDAGTLRYAWWVDDPSSNQGAKLWTKFLTHLAARMKVRGIRLADGLNLDRVPPNLRKRNLDRDEQLKLAKIFDASLLAAGDVRFSQGDGGDKAQLQVELVEVSGAHALGSTQSQLGPAKDGPEALLPKVADALNDEVKAAEASGRMNIASFRLTIHGSLSFLRLQHFREELLSQVLDIHALRDRRYAPGEMVFEAESNRSPSELAAQIRKAHFSQVKVDAQEATGGGINLNIVSL